MGSENSSGAGVGGVWKSGNLEIWGPRNPEIWRSGDLEIQKFGSKKAKKKYISKFKSVLPKMSARSGLVGKNPPGPTWGHLRPFFPWTGKMQKMLIFCLFFLGGPLLLSTLGGAIGNQMIPLWTLKRSPFTSLWKLPIETSSNYHVAIGI